MDVYRLQKGTFPYDRAFVGEGWVLMKGRQGQLLIPLDGTLAVAKDPLTDALITVTLWDGLEVTVEGTLQTYAKFAWVLERRRNLAVKLLSPTEACVGRQRFKRPDPSCAFVLEDARSG